MSQTIRHRAGRFCCDHPACRKRHNDRGGALACCGDRPLPGDLVTDGGHELRCAHCDTELRAGRVFETEHATHREYRCPSCGRAGRRTEPVDGQPREFGQAFNPRRGRRLPHRGQPVTDGGRCRA